jgi:hypothetical protein
MGAEMIGTTRPRISIFMNKFRKLGFIDYNGGGLQRNQFLDRLTFATMITAAKIAFRNSCGSSIIARPLSRARRQSEEEGGEDRTARTVQLEDVLEH